MTAEQWFDVGMFILLVLLFLGLVVAFVGMFFAERVYRKADKINRETLRMLRGYGPDDS